ncbi:MAG: type II toxin-antitoxin system ParD family antitoxin [Proteobacteria bacterium]|nr:type II toxin-antitoxin system ParD family antitoxin [Pseudomonadota bacterium]
MARTSRPISVTLGDMHESVEARVKRGDYASASEVLRAAMRALNREEAAVNAWLREQIQISLDDPRPELSIDEAFTRVRQHAALKRAD